MQRVQDMEIKELHLRSESWEDTKFLAESILSNLTHLKDFTLRFVDTVRSSDDEPENPMLTLRSQSITRLVMLFHFGRNQLRLDMPNLTCLTMFSDTYIDYAADIIDSLAIHSPGLSQLACCFDFFDEDEFPFDQLIRLANLTSIKLVGSGTIQEPIETIFPPKLTELELERVEFDVNGIPALLSVLPNLHTLVLRKIPGLSSFEGSFSRSIRMLYLGDMRMGPLVLSSYFPSLCEVTLINSTSNSKHEQINLSEISIEVIDMRALPDLRSFYAQGRAVPGKMIFGGNERLLEVDCFSRFSSPVFHFNAPHLDSIKIECGKPVIEELNCPMLSTFKVSCLALHPKEVWTSTPHFLSH